jgi:predicted nicotinamide N-methyase
MAGIRALVVSLHLMFASALHISLPEKSARLSQQLDRRVALQLAAAAAGAGVTAIDPAHASASECIEREIQGAFESDCMRDASRSFEWESTGSLKLEQGMVGPGATGAAVWNAGSALADYLAANPAAVSGKLVIELGCGTGLCGLVASRLGAKAVLVTDGVDAILERAQRNIDANAKDGKIRTRKLQWGTNAVEEQLRGKFDVVLASDVLYQSSAWRALGATASDLLKPKTGRLLLAEAGHETTPTQPTLEGFRTVAEGCGLIFEDSIALGGSAVLQVCRKRD